MNNNIFKQSAILLRDNLMTIQPLFFWILIMMFIIRPLFLKPSIDLGFIFTAILAVFCFTAFLAGWYNSIKYTISLKNNKYETPEERNKAQYEILKSFFPGVGEYIFPVTLAFIIYVVLAYGTVELYRFFSMKIFTMYNFPNEMLTVINTGTQPQVADYIQHNLSNTQLMALTGLFFGAIFIFLLFSTVILWYAPAIFYSTKNPISAMVYAIKFLFSNFTKSITIVLVMFGINTLISILNIFIGNNFLAFIPLLLTFTYLLYYVETVFLYYESKTQNNCPDGSECNG